MLAIFGLCAFSMNTAERVKLWFRDEVRKRDTNILKESKAYTFLVYFDNVMYVIMFVPAVYVIERFGIRLALFIGVFASLIGTWIALMPRDLIGVQIVG